MLSHRTSLIVIRNLFAGNEFRQGVESLSENQISECIAENLRSAVVAKLDGMSIDLSWYIASLSASVSSPVLNERNNELRVNAMNFVKQLSDAAYEPEDSISISMGFRHVTIDLTFDECLFIINSLAVHNVEVYQEGLRMISRNISWLLLLTLCKLFRVPEWNYRYGTHGNGLHSNFFYLFDNHDKHCQCEVKLMGQGNPESADAVIARDTHVFVADKLSDLNKQQLDNRGIQWVELRSENGYRRFYAVLRELGVPCQDFDGDLDTRLTEIFSEIFDSPTST